MRNVVPLRPRSASLRPTGCKLAGIVFGALASLAWRTGPAAPRVPANDVVVLEHVPAAVASAKLEPLRARWSARPGDLHNALALAQGYLDIGRATADPRFVSYAQATLKPWLSGEHPDPAVLTLAATCLQYLHRFDEALALLDRALGAQPFNGQAWLTKATILQVQGRFAQARQACRPLIQTSGHLIALTCLTSVSSLTGGLDASYHALNGVFTDDPRLESGVRVWILDELADMAERLGDDRAAEAHFLAALQAAPQDGYSKAAYADLLLRENRDAEVVQLLQEDTSQDNLLLRVAIAATRLRSVRGQRFSEMFQARYEAARRDGDFTHLREQARFILEVRGDAAHALQLAEHNWQVQREPADVRVYYAAAMAAKDQTALHKLRMWVTQAHYEDRTLDSFGSPGGGPADARVVGR